MKRLAIVHSQEKQGPQEVEVLEYKDLNNLKVRTKDGVICKGVDNPWSGYVYADDVYGVIAEESPEKCVMQYESFYSGATDVTLKIETYSKGLPIRIQLYCDEGPFATLTTNLDNDSGNGSIMSPFCGWVDVNNNPEAEDFIRNYSLGEPYTRFGEPVLAFSGYCCYPLYQFDKQKLMELDPKGTAAYEENYKKHAEKARKKLLRELGGMC